MLLNEVASLFLLNKKITFKLSGGLDTRLICFALQEIGLAPDRVISVQSPFVPSGEDADVEIPKQICKVLGWNHSIQTPSPETYRYLDIPDENEVVLSGLYGGEIYGGQAGNFLNSLKNWNHPQAVSAFANSCRSTFYNSVVGSWSSPVRLHQQAFSPYITSDFVRYLLSVDFLELKNYLGYKNHYEILKLKHFDLPLCSALSMYHSEFQLPSGKSFKDPKPFEKRKNPKVENTQKLRFKMIDYATEKWTKDKGSWHKNSYFALKNLNAYCNMMNDRFRVHL